MRDMIKQAVCFGCEITNFDADCVFAFYNPKQNIKAKLKYREYFYVYMLLLYYSGEG